MGNQQIIEINSHRYKMTEYGLLPSVTTILSATKPVYIQRAIEIWKTRNANHQVDNQAAIDRGTLVHKQIESLLQGHKVDNLNQLVRLANPLLNQITSVTALESTLIDLQHGFTGTLDAICIYKNELVLFDWKTVSKNSTLAVPSKRKSRLVDYKQQISAYAYLWELYNTTLAKAIIVLLIEDSNEPVLIELNRTELVESRLLFFDRVRQFKQVYGFDF